MISRQNSKSVSIFLSLDDWKALRLEAARQQISMTEFCRRCLKPVLHGLSNSSNSSTFRDDTH